MARNDGIDRTSARNVDVPDKDIGNTQKHNEREKDSYRNPDIIPERLSYNVHFKKPAASYTELFAQMESSGTISTPKTRFAFWARNREMVPIPQYKSQTVSSPFKPAYSSA